jgi:hypothetical protein
MKLINLNLTIDNAFRNPFRWGSCPINLKKEWVLGIRIYSQHIPTRIGIRYTVVIYLYYWYIMFNNEKESSKKISKGKT